MHTDRFTPLDAATLLRWMQHDLPNKQLFGIDRELFFMPKPDDPFRMERYGKVLETPLGVAAGPHTQLAQNILSAWLCGARYIELKTVQVLDELNVAKPCIDMADEGYNCEWSQELKLDQSFEEYLKAFVLLYVLRDMLNLPVEAEPGKGPGFIFNMSAGYNLEGIKSPALQRFLDRMENAEEDVKRIKAGLAPLYPAIEKMPIPARLSDNLTVSTMHGCPPDEVESIGRYFITERKYNTAIKLNPTLLGPERLRDILNTQLGYDVCVPDEAFGHDLKYNDGVAIIRKALEAPMRAIAQNAGFEGSVVVERVKGMGKGEGLNCANGEYGNMIEMGVNDPVKVTRTALQSAASVAALILITEATINDIPKDPDPAALAAMAGAGGGMGGMM